MRLTAFIFTFFYLISSIGYGIEVHYCLGRISDVNHYLLGTECPCDQAHVESTKSCCEERAVFNQLEDEHAAPVKVEVSHVKLPLYSEIDMGRMEAAVESVFQVELISDRGPPKVRDLTIELVRLITYG